MLNSLFIRSAIKRDLSTLMVYNPSISKVQQFETKLLQKASALMCNFNLCVFTVTQTTKQGIHVPESKLVMAMFFLFNPLRG